MSPFLLHLDASASKILLSKEETSDFSMPYIKKILERWYKAGIRDGLQLTEYLKNESKLSTKKSDKKETFDVDQFNKALNQLPE